MAAFTTTPTPTGEGPLSMGGIAKSIGTKIRDAAEQAKEEKEKATKAGETPEKGSLFKSALKNQFNPVKSKKAKGNWNKQFSWNQKSDKPDAVNGKPTGGGAGGGEKLKNFIAGGFSAIIADTTQMVAKLSSINEASDSTASATSRSTGTLVQIKELLDTQTDLKTQQIENQERAVAESKLEQTRQTGSTDTPSTSEGGMTSGEGEGGGGGGGGGLLDGLLNGLDGIENIMQIKNLLAPAGEAAAGEAGTGLLGAAAPAAIVAGTMGLLSAGGEGMFQLSKWGDQTLKDRSKSIKDKKARGENTFLDETLQAGQTGLGEVGKTLGVAADVGGAPLRMLLEAVRNPFLDEKGKQEQGYNLAKYDTRIREHARGWMNRIDFMNIIPDQKGGFGNIYGNDAATKEMAGKMSKGGIIKKLAPGGVVDNPTRTMLNPGDAVIPLNRNAGKEFLGGETDDKKGDPKDLALDTVGAMILGVSSRMLGITDTGTVGDQVKQKISKAAKEFGISNLTFQSDIGSGQFGKVDTNKSAKDFMESLFKGINIAGGTGGSSKGGKNGEGGNPPGEAPPGLKADLEADIGKNASQMKDEIMQSGATGIIDPTQGPWCAAYVNSQLKRQGIQGSGSPAANSFENWGAPVDKNNIKYGDVIVGDYGGGSKSHVMFAAGSPKDGAVEIIGGNQGGAVTRGTIALDKIDYVRRAGSQPPRLPTPKNNGQAPAQAQRPPAPQRPANPTNRQVPLTSPTVTQLKPASDGMVGPSWMPWNWGKLVDKHRSTKSSDYANPNSPLARMAKEREMMKELGYESGGTNHRTKEESMRAWAETLRRRRATQQRTRLGVQKVNGKWVNMGVSDKAVAKPWWQTFTDYWGMTNENTNKQRKAKQEALAKGLADRLNRQEGLNRPAPAAAPQRARAPVPASRPAAGGGGGASKPSATVVNNTMTVPSASSSSSASTAGSFGGAVPGGKTRAMGFADFLYEDLV